MLRSSPLGLAFTLLACSSPGAGDGGAADGGVRDGRAADVETRDAALDVPQDSTAERDGSRDASAALLPLEEGELLPGGETTTPVVGASAFLQEAANLSVLRRGDFQAGLQFFQLDWEVAPGRPEADGLGPTFNATSCIGCHERNGRGLVTGGVLLRLGSEAGADSRYGNQLQPLAVSGVPGEGIVTATRDEVRSFPLSDGDVRLFEVRYVISDLPFGPLDAETRTSARIAQQLVGQGLLEAVEHAEILRFEDPDDDDADGVSGRAAWIDGDTLGRFGWKAAQPDVEAQTAAAFAGDLGLTSSRHPTENCPVVQVECRATPTGGSPELPESRLRVTSAYVRLLGVPARRGGDAVLEGKTLFHRVGCASCHRPSMTTGTALEPELTEQRIWPYTDLLLHDMGPELDDGVPEGVATSSEWRTAPLWGIGLVEAVNAERHLLHDGRASTLEEAVVWHGGEAASSRTRYSNLTSAERLALHAFIESL